MPAGIKFAPPEGDAGTGMVATNAVAPVTVMKTAGEGGAYGIALLAAFADLHGTTETLEDFLSKKVFKNAESLTLEPDSADVDGFEKYTENYIKLLEVEKTAIKNMR